MQPQRQGNYTSTVARTFNRKTEFDYNFFKDCVMYTFKAALIAMAYRGDTIAVLCHVSGGIYAGRHRNTYGDRGRDLNDLKQIVDAALQQPMPNSNFKIGQYFDKVYFSKYAMPNY